MVTTVGPIEMSAQLVGGFWLWQWTGFLDGIGSFTGLVTNVFETREAL